MSLTFDSVFTAFQKRFPPVDRDDQAVLKLSTQEILDAFNELGVPFTSGVSEFVSFLAEKGYCFVPVEENDRVRFFWLIGKDQESY